MGGARGRLASIYINIPTENIRPSVAKYSPENRVPDLS